MFYHEPPGYLDESYVLYVLYVQIERLSRRQYAARPTVAPHQAQRSTKAALLSLPGPGAFPGVLRNTFALFWRFLTRQ